MRIVHFAMKLAPVAVFAIIFNTAFTFGTGVLSSLFLYVVTVVAGLLLQQFGVYSAMLWIVARRSPVDFLPQCREVYLYAFSTASSNATLPLSLEVAETKLRLPPTHLALRADGRVRRPIRTAPRCSKASRSCFWRRSTASI